MLLIVPTQRSISSASGGSSLGSPDSGGGRTARRSTAAAGGNTPATRRSHLSHTPASIKRLIKGKSPWKKLTDTSEVSGTMSTSPLLR